MCFSEYLSKLKNRGIGSMYVGVELLYKHTGTPRGLLAERFLTSRTKRIGKRCVWKIRQNDLAFRINRPVIKVLLKILLGFQITKPIFERKRRRR